jgi:hypothetical protein
MRTPSPPPEEIRHGLATLYDNTFPTHEEYREFTVNCLTMWGNTLDYKLFDTLYLTHQYHFHTIENKLWHCWRRPTKSTNATWWLDMRSRATSKQLLSPIFDNESKNHNESESLFLLLPFLVPLDNQTILIVQPMDETMLDVNINVLNAATPHISNETVLFTPVELAIKRHLDTHHEHAMDASMMMEFRAITI